MNLEWIFLLLVFILSNLLIGADTIIVIIWWLSLLIIGFIFLPVTAKIFSKFFDKGYLFSKIIGLVFLTFSLWLFSIVKILPFYRVTIFGLLLAAIGIIFIGLKGLESFKSFLKAKDTMKIFVCEETLFLLGLIFFAFVRGQLPDIHGTEKFMDFAFLNNLLRTKFLPPVDMWLAGKTANYYYYGHYLFAFLTKLTGIQPSFTYNLGMATLFTFGFSLTFSLTANLVYLLGKSNIKRVILAGLISASLLSLGGNLHTFVYAVALPFAKNISIYQGNVKSYFYPDPRSYIGTNPPTKDILITEYPAYSYVLGDLHAQIINIFFVLTFIALLLAFFARTSEEIKTKNKPGPWYWMPKESVMMFLMLPVMWMTNAWDFPIYFVVMSAVFLGVNLIKYDFGIKSIIITLINVLKVLIISLLLLSPFLIRFINPTQGFHLTHLEHIFSPLYLFQMFVIWGYQLFFVVLFVDYIFRVEPKYSFSKKISSQNFFNRFRQFYARLATTDIFVLILSICAIGLVLVSEIFYQKDVSGVDYYRANTVWKVTLQAFILFDVVIGYIVIRILSIKRSRIKQYILGTTIAVILGLAMLYPRWSIPQAYNNLRDYKGLDGTAYLTNLYPDDYKAIQWLNSTVSGQPVIIEAVGESYTDFARVSANTGLPTILGWRVHEWYWRGSFDEAGKRTEEVREIYESTDLVKTKALLSKYQVSYIFIGDLEKKQYQNLNGKKFENLGELVFIAGETKVYSISNDLR